MTDIGQSQRIGDYIKNVVGYGIEEDRSVSSMDISEGSGMIMRSRGRDTTIEGSNSTTSLIEALFIDEQLEMEEKIGDRKRGNSRESECDNTQTTDSSNRIDIGVMGKEDREKGAIKGSEQALSLDIQSEISSIDLIDSKMLLECMQQQEGGLESKRREGAKGGKGMQGWVVEEAVGIEPEEVIDLKEDRDFSQSENGMVKSKLGKESVENREGSEGSNMGVSKGVRVGIEGGGRYTNIEESRDTTSSIAVLFVDKQLEKEGKKIGSKKVIRRMVWGKWKGVIRGEIRRDIRSKRRVARKVEKEDEDRKIVFDYTTKGLSVEEAKLLGKGESFCVVDYKIDEDRNRVDIYQYQRRLRLHEAFREGEDRTEEEIGEVCTPVVSGNRVREQDSRFVNDTIRRATRGGRESMRSIRGRVEGSISRRSLSRNNRVSVGTRGQNNNEGIARYRSQESRRGGGVEDTQARRERGRRGASRGRGGIRVERSSTLGRSDTIGRRESVLSTVGRGTGRGEILDRRGSVGLGEVVEVKEGRRLPSIYDPDSQNRNLHRYNTCIQEEISLAMGNKKVEFRDNITKEERGALKALKQRVVSKERVVTRADKGSGLVAVDYDKYIAKGTKYIEEEAGAYSRVQELEQAIIGRLVRDRNKIAEQLKEKGVIEVQTATYVRKQLEEKITGIKFFYKIHKDRRIDSMPLRPLQSCIKSPMQHLSIVLTDILQPLLIDRNIQSFIFDSNQLLFRLSRLCQIPVDCTLISSDVSALYPSIPHEAGFRAMQGFLREKTTYNEQQIDSLIKALELVITENFMIWNGQIYKQVSGVAMGTPVAVAYANIFMNWVDIEVRKKAPYIHEHIRYIDDNLFILPGDRVEHLMQIANNVLPPYIKFTYERLDSSSGKGLPFLDTQLSIGRDRRIEARLYTKSTDRHAYLLPTSYHPPHITRNIPLAVFGRLRKICSREEWFEEDAKKAVGWLEGRGYKRVDIQKALDKTRLKDRWSMIEGIEKNRVKDKQKKEGTVTDIPFIMTYNQHTSKIRQILKDRQPLLDSAFKKTKVRPRLSYRRKSNLNDTIVQKGLRGPIEDNRKKLNIFSKCGEKPGYRSKCPCKGIHRQEDCRCCIHSIDKLQGIEGKIYKPVDCNSRNIIYVIEYRVCSKRYVGETQQRLKDRLAQHMYNVEKLNQPLYLHFRLVHKLDKLGIGIVETVRGVEPFMRKVREAWWINHLKTLEPSGFNVKLECNQMYEETR